MTDILYSLTDVNFNKLYIFLVWTNCILCVAWVSMALNDPSLCRLPSWQVHGRRAALIIMSGGWMWSILFGGALNWNPWPPMLMVLFGQNVYFFISVATIWLRARERTQRQGDRVGLSAGL